MKINFRMKASFLLISALAVSCGKKKSNDDQVNNNDQNVQLTSQSIKLGEEVKVEALPVAKADLPSPYKFLLIRSFELTTDREMTLKVEEAGSASMCEEGVQSKTFYTIENQGNLVATSDTVRYGEKAVSFAPSGKVAAGSTKITLTFFSESNCLSYGASFKVVEAASVPSPQKQNDPTTPTKNPEEPVSTPSEAFDTALVGTWMHSSSGTDEKSTFDSAGLSTTKLTFGDKVILDVSFQSKTISTTTPKKIVSMITEVRAAPEELALKAGDVSSCIYEITADGSLKMECSEINDLKFPESFGTDAIVYRKM